MLRTLDLFSGIGMFSIAMHATGGFTTVAACERKAWKRAIFRDLVGDMPIYPNVKTLTGARVLSDVGPIDVIFGSPPCTDASAANTSGRGVDGDETGLFFDAIRLCDELRPAWVVLENVDRIRTRGADRICAALEDIDYACWPLVVGAANAGAPHLRKRCWFVAANANSERIREQPWRRAFEHADGNGRQHARGRRFGGDTCVEAANTGADTTCLGRRQGRSGRLGAVRAGKPEQALLEPSDATGERRDGRSATVERGPGREPVRAPEPTNTHSARLAFWQSLAPDHATQLAALERDIGPAVHQWSGGLGRYLCMADGLPARTARMLMSGAGDAVVGPVVTSIGQAILEAEGLR